MIHFLPIYKEIKSEFFPILSSVTSSSFTTLAIISKNKLKSLIIWYQQAIYYDTHLSPQILSNRGNSFLPQTFDTNYSTFEEKGKYEWASGLRTSGPHWGLLLGLIGSGGPLALLRVPHVVCVSDVVIYAPRSTDVAGRRVTAPRSCLLYSRRRLTTVTQVCFPKIRSFNITQTVQINIKINRDFINVIQ